MMDFVPVGIDDIPNWMEVIKNIPNHQAVMANYPHVHVFWLNKGY